ncbi:MFS transporter [Streptomyces sp. S1D4-11]|nr:MFS transporter [Streptomyces sp. S1D4-11]QIY99986.1 MFS transporter [Streptomyces sp. S1D4-11]
MIGVATVFYEVAYQSTLPRLLPLNSIAAANGLHQATYSVSTLAGPAAAGFLVGQLGVSPTLRVAATCSAGAAVSGLLLRGVKAPEQPRESALKAIGSGLRYTWSLRPIRDLCVQAGLSNLHEKAFLTVFLVFAVRDLGMRGTTVGVITGIGSVGALIGLLCATRLTQRWAVGGVLALGAVLAAVGLLLVPAVSRVGGYVAVLASVAMMVNGFGVALFNVFAVCLRQAIPPEHQIGAVNRELPPRRPGHVAPGSRRRRCPGRRPVTRHGPVGRRGLLPRRLLLAHVLPLRGARTLEEAQKLGRTTDTPESQDADRSPSV